MFNLNFVPIFISIIVVLIFIFRYKFCHLEKNKRREIKITDLNVYCLEYILQYLDLEDLLNASDSNIHLRNEAKLIFRRRYSQMMVVLGYENKDVLPLLKTIVIETNIIKVNSMKMSLRILRCFGCLISKIELGSQFNTMVFYLKSMKHNVETMKCCIVPYKRIMKVEDFEMGILGLLIDFAKIVPNMKELTISNKYLGCNLFTHFGYCVNNFSHLESLTVDYRMHLCEECVGNIFKCLHLNPQLKSFQFCSS